MKSSRAWAQECNWKRDRCGFNFEYGGMKYLLFSFFHSSDKAKRGVEIRHSTCIASKAESGERTALLTHIHIHPITTRCLQYTLNNNNLSITGIKNFNCTECGASFYRKADLDRHEKIHTGVKPFQCEICSKSFTQKNNLVMHFKMHIGDKPHECEVCNKRFLTRSKMLLHSKKHEKAKKKKELLGHI